MRRGSFQRLHDERGFTLTEMLASIAVLGVLFAMFATLLSTTITQGTQEQETSVLQSEARAAMERFARELRQAYTGVDGTWPIVSIATNNVHFLSADRLEPFHLQQIEWRLSSGDLQRRSVTSTDTDGPPWVYPSALSAAPWTTEARSIRNGSIFRFADENDLPTTVAADVRKVTITLEVSTVGQAGRTSTYQTSITPRVSRT